jgi:hypothetical protein
MDRRKYLAGVSTGLFGALGGCFHESNVGMRLSLINVDDGLDPLVFSVDVVEDNLTSSTIPLLDISVENTGDETVTWLFAPNAGRPSKVVFPCAGAEPDKLVIGHEDEMSYLQMDDRGCARTDEIDRAQAPVDTELSPGNTLEQRYAIVGDETKIDGKCPPEDTYWVGCLYYHSNPIEEFGSWGFEIELSSQES